MPWAIRLGTTAAVLAVIACHPHEPASTAAQADPPTPECIRYQAEARARYPGYDHLIHLFNACESQAHCAVSTNVDPQPIFVDLEVNQKATVMTRRGSPAREFTPYVTCQLADQPAPPTTQKLQTAKR